MSCMINYQLSLLRSNSISGLYTNANSYILNWTLVQHLCDVESLVWGTVMSPFHVSPPCLATPHGLCETCLGLC